jgi:hypothetical protein
VVNPHGTLCAHHRGIQRCLYTGSTTSLVRRIANSRERVFGFPSLLIPVAKTTCVVNTRTNIVKSNVACTGADNGFILYPVSADGLPNVSQSYTHVPPRCVVHNATDVRFTMACWLRFGA